MLENTFPRLLGSYVLLRPLAQGGMGDLLLARHDGAAGIKKFCVVKTLRAHLHGDPEYVKRFVDEATVVVQLTHRNICQVYDVGKSGENIFLVMEHITGFDLGTVRERAETRGVPLSRAISIHVVGEILEALDYAHRHVDPLTGERLGLVHRDISPHNAMLNAEGEVKLIDFGLAATGEQLSEEAGSSTVMGKLAYMSPEQARGEVIDGRADQFAAAVVLYELLTGARFYGGMTPKQVWSVAGMGTHAPAHLDDLPAPLQAILRRALAPDKEDRYPTCGDFREALASYAYDHHLRVTTRDVRELMAALFADELANVRRMLQEQATVDLDVHKPAPSEVFERIATTMHGGTTAEPTEFVTARSRVADTPTTSVLRIDAVAARTEPPPSSTKPLVAALIALAGLVVVAALVFSLSRSSDDISVTALPDLPPAPPVVDAPTPPATSPPPDEQEPTIAAEPAAATPSAPDDTVDGRPATTRTKPRLAKKQREPRPSRVTSAQLARQCRQHCLDATKKGRDLNAIPIDELERMNRDAKACQVKCEANGGP